MNPLRATGPEAGVLKYDLLTALSVVGLNGSSTLQTSLMRLIAVITARYNWRSDEFVVGQRDLARMWSVNERTVKREIKRLTDMQLLICKRPGVRGRVGAYRLNQQRLAELSEPCWALVGPDFDHRMREKYAQRDVKVVQLNAYTPTPVPNGVSALPGTWERAMAHLARSEPDQFKSWFSRLEFVGLDSGILTVKCPSTFVRRYIETHLTRPLLRAAQEELGPIDKVILH